MTAEKNVTSQWGRCLGPVASLETLGRRELPPSLDPVALDKAGVDLIYAADPEKSASLRGRMESRNGIHTLDHAEALGLGSQRYELVSIDP